MKHFLLFLTTIIITFSHSIAQEPTAVVLSSNGKLDWVYYDFTNTPTMHPLTGIYFTGRGEVKYLRFSVNGYAFLMNNKGVAYNPLQGPFEVEWNSDNQIDEFKKGYTTFMRFDYDHDGFLEEVEDGSFKTLFQLDYNHDGTLNNIDMGTFDYMVQLDYDHDGELDEIKDGKYNYVWNMDYDYDGRLDEIKDRNYKDIVTVKYHSSGIGNISKYNSNTQFYTGDVHINFLHGTFSQHNQPAPYNPHPHHHNNCHNHDIMMASFYEHTNYGGKRLNYNWGHYPYLPNEWKNKISSITIPAGIKVIAYSSPNFQGKCMVLTGSWSASSASDFWNDRVASIKIEKY